MRSGYQIALLLLCITGCSAWQQSQKTARQLANPHIDATQPSHMSAAAAAVAVATAFLTCASPAHGADIAFGSIRLPDGVSVPPDAALYVTARPDRPDNVPVAILTGTRGEQF